MTDPSAPTPAPPADWYPDPSGQWDHRYWNGHSWTAHVSRAGVAYVDQDTAHLPTGQTRQPAGAAQPERTEEASGDLAAEPVDRPDEATIAEVDAGRLPVISDPPILTRRNELVHGVFRVDQLEEAAAPDQGGAIGAEPAVQDSGLLAVTSTRSVFSGQRRALEFRHDRLVDLQGFPDGLRLAASGRQATALFRFARGSSPALAAALIAALRPKR